MISYTSRSGEKIENPEVSSVEHMLFDEPETWAHSPDLSLAYTYGGSVSKLLVAYAGEYGYHVQLLDSERQMWLLVPNRNNIDPEIVEIDADYCVSVGLISDRQLAWAAVKWFMENGTKSSSAAWISDHEVPEGVCF